jgi:hypothetical protein
MAFFSHALSPSETAFTPAPGPRPSLLTRFVRAMRVARQHQADREIAAYLLRTGGKLTDSAEREIERRFLAPAAHQ